MAMKAFASTFANVRMSCLPSQRKGWRFGSGRSPSIQRQNSSILGSSPRIGFRISYTICMKSSSLSSTTANSTSS